MRRLFISLLTWLIPVLLVPQDLQLKDCIRDCLNNNPLSANKELARQIAGIRKNIIQSAWLPNVDVNGQATWQSDVVTLNLDLPFPVTFPQIPKDQYKVTADISQMIYDGGSIKKQKVLEDISSDLSVAELEVRDYELRQSVEDLYFAILVTEKRIEVVKLMAESVGQTISQVESGLKNGILSESDLAVIMAEKIRIDQQLISMMALKNRAISTLGILMGKEIPGDARFIIPADISITSANGERPEYHLFDVQIKMTEARKSLLTSQQLPKVAAFGQAGYGKPGLNFMGDKWEPYLVVGIKGTWNVWDWGRVKHQKETFNLNNTVIDNQQLAFTRQVSQAEKRQQLSIDEIGALLSKDEELLVNREKVTQAYKSRLSNGLITASQYIAEWTREQEARINHEVRAIELVSAQYKLLSIKGKN